MNGRFGSLNGWRAISILLVLGCHTQFVQGCPPEYKDFFKSWFDGNLGVRFFFSISGFLITWLILAEEAERDRFSLKRFYIRRCLRIWPVYFAYVAVALTLQFSGINIQSPQAWRGVLTFTRNFHDTVTGSDGDWFTNHLWSLSVEEQFYLFWPLILFFFGKRVRIGFLLAAILFSIGFRTIEFLGLYSRDHSHFLFQENSTFNYLDCLGWGCLGAFFMARYRPTLETLAKAKSTTIFVVCFSMVLIPYLAGLGAGVQAVGFVGLLLHSVLCPDWGFYRVLNYKWMDRIGIWSYSIYVWQELVMCLWPASLERVWFLWIPVAFVFARVSYELLEKPFFALRSEFRHTLFGQDKENPMDFSF